MTRYSWVPTSQDGILRLDGQSRRGDLSDINIPHDWNSHIHIQSDEINTPCPAIQTNHQTVDVSRTELLDLSGESLSSSQNPLHRRLFTSQRHDKTRTECSDHDNIMEDGSRFSRIPGNGKPGESNSLSPRSRESDNNIEYLHSQVVTERKPVHRWSNNPNEVKVMSILRRFYDLEWPDITTIMNEFFDTKHSQKKFDNHQCNSKFWGLRHGRTHDSAFNEVILDIDFEAGKESWLGIRRDIEQAAHRARVPLYSRCMEEGQIQTCRDARHRLFRKQKPRVQKLSRSSRNGKSTIGPTRLKAYVFPGKKNQPLPTSSQHVGARPEFVRPPLARSPQLDTVSNLANRLASRSISITSPEKDSSPVLVGDSSRPEPDTSLTCVFLPEQSRRNEATTSLTIPLHETRRLDRTEALQTQAQSSQGHGIALFPTSIAGRGSNDLTSFEVDSDQINRDAITTENNTSIPSIDLSSNACQPEIARGHPAVVFRFWDSTSSTKYSHPSGFLSGRLSRKDPGFQVGKGPDIPFDHTDYLMEADSHFFEYDTPSKFISVTDSLLWVIQMAARSFSKGREARIAIMDFSKIKEQTSVQYAGPVLKKLKSDSPSFRCRYKGTGEWLIWQRIYPEAILKVVRFADIQSLAMTDTGVAQLLRLQFFGTKDTIKKLRERLQESPMCLDQESGRAIGRMASFLGFSMDSPRDFREAIVFNFVDGWFLISNSDRQAKKIALQGFHLGITSPLEAEDMFTRGMRSVEMSQARTARSLRL